MAAIAVIGGDGAGKTTITRQLLESSDVPFRYLYMGINVDSSNVALPSARLAAWFRRRREAREATATAGNGQPSPGPSKSKVRSVLRLANRVSEEWFRQLMCWQYELRGYVVLCDRHFVFDFAEVEAQPDRRLSDRIHAWLLRHAYPRPDLVIFLDAPPEVLMARKGEATLEILGARRRAFLRMGESTENFIRVDATQPLERVYAEVTDHVGTFCNGRRSSGLRDSRRS